MSNFTTLIFPWCYLYLLLCTEAVVAVNIGAIVDTSSHTGREQTVAIEIAVEHFNTSASPVFLSFRNVSSLRAAGAVEDLTSAWRADVVLVGANTWTDDNLAAELKSSVQVPVISFPTGPTLAPGTTWPYLVSMPSQLSSKIRCIADLVGSYKWRRIIVVYEDDSFGTISAKGTSLLSDALRAVRSGVLLYKSFPRHDSLENPRTSIREGLQELNASSCRVFVVLQASSAFATDLFQEATSLNMMEQGYVWITNDNIIGRLNSSMSPYTQGAVEIRNYVNLSDPSYQIFLAEFKQRLGSDRYPGIFTLRAYDAIQLVSMAAKSIASKKENSTSKLHLKGITASRFHGLSGHIRFRHGELPSNGTMFRIVNIVGNGYREMGFWSEGVGFHKSEVMKTATSGSAAEVFGSVYWPGGPLWVPGGWDVLNVVIPVNPSFSEFVKAEYEDGKFKNATGFCIEVFEAALARLPYKLRFQYIPFTGTYDDVVYEIHANQSRHVSVGDITILRNRSRFVDFTATFMESGLSKLVPVRGESRTWLFVRPFTIRFWFWIILFSLYNGFIVWYLERQANPEEYGGPLRRQIGAGMWSAFALYIPQLGTIRNGFTKLALVVSILVALVLTQSYTASLSSILTVQKLEPDNRNGEGEKIGYQGLSFVLNYLKRVVLPHMKEDFQKIESEDDLRQAFLNGTITSAYLETPYIRVFLAKYGSDYTVTGETYRLGGFGFAFKKGSPLTSDISKAILNMTEDGTLKRLEAKAFALDLFSCPEVDPSVKRVSLDIDSFSVLFLISGVISAGIAIASYFLRNNYRRGRDGGPVQPPQPPDVGGGERPPVDEQPPNGDLQHGDEGKSAIGGTTSPN